MAKKGRKSRKGARVKSIAVHRAPMAKAKSTFKKVASRGTLNKAQSVFKKAAGGVGGGVIAEDLVDMVAPGPMASIAGYGGAYLGGGMTGVLAKLGFDVLTGKATWLAGVFPSANGGGSNGGSL